MPTSGRSETASNFGCSVTPVPRKCRLMAQSDGSDDDDRMVAFGGSRHAPRYGFDRLSRGDPQRHRRANFALMHNAALDPANLMTGSLPCEVACNAHLYTFPNSL